MCVLYAATPFIPSEALQKESVHLLQAHFVSPLPQQGKMASAKRVLSGIQEPQLKKKARVSKRKSSQSLSHKNVGDCYIVSSPPHQFSIPVPLPPVPSPPPSNIPVATPSPFPQHHSRQSSPPLQTSALALSTHLEISFNDSVVSVIAGKIDELHAYLDEKFVRLEAQMDTLFANFSRRISQLEDRLLANIAMRCRTVAADGDEGVLDPSMGLSKDADGQLREDVERGEDVGDNMLLQPSHHDTVEILGGSVISESSSQLVHVTKLKATCSTQTSAGIRR